MFRLLPGGNEAVIMATLVGIVMATDIPCAVRAPMSQYPSCDQPQARMESPRKKAPIMLTIFESVRSAMAPATRRHDPLARLRSSSVGEPYKLVRRNILIHGYWPVNKLSANLFSGHVG